LLVGTVNLALIVSLVSASLAFGSAWTIQNWRFDARELQRAEQNTIEQRAAFKDFERGQNRVITAQSAAARRISVLRRSADAARSELDRLRDASATALRAAAASHDASLAAAATANQLLNRCGAEYQELGAIADRHVSDLRTLIDAWPK
jgi:chromosome segregation ATPase